MDEVHLALLALLPIRVSIPMPCCSSQPLVHLVFLFKLVLLRLSLKLKETERKGIFYQWFCRIVFGGLCLGHVGNLGVSQGLSVGREGALEAFRSSQCQQPCDESLGTRHNALSTAGSSPLVRFSTAAPREINVF